jgi:hypothetical protein
MEKEPSELFIDIAEKFADKVFADKRKEDLDKLCLKAQKYEKYLCGLQKQEHEGYYMEGEKKIKVCRCSACSQTRQREAEIVLPEYNRLLWEIFPKNKNWVWIETRREDKQWDFYRVDYKEGKECQTVIGNKH